MKNEKEIIQAMIHAICFLVFHQIFITLWRVVVLQLNIDNFFIFVWGGFIVEFVLLSFIIYINNANGEDV